MDALAGYESDDGCSTDTNSVLSNSEKPANKTLIESGEKNAESVNGSEAFASKSLSKLSQSMESSTPEEENDEKIMTNFEKRELDRSKNAEPKSREPPNGKFNGPQAKTESSSSNVANTKSSTTERQVGRKRNHSRSRSRSKSGHHSSRSRSRSRSPVGHVSKSKTRRSRSRDKSRSRSRDPKSRSRSHSPSRRNQKHGSHHRYSDKKTSRGSDSRKSRSGDSHRRRRRSGSRSRRSGSHSRRHSRSHSRERRRRSHSRSRDCNSRRSRSRSKNRRSRRSRSRERSSRYRSRSKSRERTSRRSSSGREVKNTAKLQPVEAAAAAAAAATEAVRKTMEGSGETSSKLPLNANVSSGCQMTPQMAVQQAMAAVNAKAQQLTGIALPKYYNPAAVNPMKYAEQMQKRKLLWHCNKEKNETQPIAASNNNWESTTFAQDQDGKMTAKFRKLMGIKTPTLPVTEEPEGMVNPNSSTMPGNEEQIKKQEEMFRKLDQQYEVARMSTHTHRGVGLGFTSQAHHLFPK